MTVIERPLYGIIMVQTFDVTGSPFVLDYSKLDYSPLGEAGDVGTWRDWTATATNISIHRGMRREGIELINEVGSATVTLIDPGDALDPATGIHPDLKGRVIVRRPGAPDVPIFTGRVHDARRGIDTDEKGHPRPILTLILADAVQTYNGITRYGAAGPDTFRQRIARLAASSSEPVQLPATSPTALQARIVTETSLTNHYTLACNGAGAMWWVGADGITRFQYRALDASADGGILDQGDLIGIDTSSGLDGWANHVYQTFTNAIPDPDNPGQWLNNEETLEKYTAPTSIGRWGERRATYAIAYEFDANDDAGLCLLRMVGPSTSPSDTPARVTVNAQRDIRRYAALEIGGYVYVNLPGIAAASALIIGIHHTITPTRWLIDLDLTGAQTS